MPRPTPPPSTSISTTRSWALTNVPFGTISGYLEFPAGDHNVKVYATGSTTDPVIDADVTVATGAKYTIAATNAVASITAQVLEDEPAPTATARRSASSTSALTRPPSMSRPPGRSPPTRW